MSEQNKEWKNKLLPKEKIIKALDLYWSFNHHPDSDSCQVFVNEYNDKWFRWEHNYFKHSKKLTAIVNPYRIVIVKTAQVQDRLRGNIGNIKFSPDKKKFACDIEIIKDIIIGGVRIDAFTEVDENLVKRMSKSVSDGTDTIIAKDASKPPKKH